MFQMRGPPPHSGRKPRKHQLSLGRGPKPPYAVFMEDKRLFLIVSPNETLLDRLQGHIQKQFSNATVFRAADGMTALTKFQNAPPHVLISEMDLPKLSGWQLVTGARATRGAETCAFILVGTPPKEERLLDELVTGQVQFWMDPASDQELSTCLVKAMNFAARTDKAEFQIRYLGRGDVLLREGDAADNVYFVKKGQLEAAKLVNGSHVALGTIEYGEFVGEMAYINGEARNALVTALTDCELIEVPIGHFENVLFKRPSWSRALMLTLSKRLKQANAQKP